MKEKDRKEKGHRRIELILSEKEALVHVEEESERESKGRIKGAEKT